MLRLFVLAMLVGPWLLADEAFRICQDPKEGTQNIFVETGEKWMALFRDDTGKTVDFVEADVCEKKDSISKEVLANIAAPENVRAACVSITNDAGDGVLAILREPKKGKYQVEIKDIVVEKPNKDKGRTLDCR
ncbi:MAG: hypothetical protein H6617_12090 [Bdellovibrionaceae bacterium]|nr:hypothetical protein [Bdellovibrionales bacterium]MCB9255414.1 hypothetical protein [Pseudobdellovibrionaceae bacterium]